MTTRCKYWLVFDANGEFVRAYLMQPQANEHAIRIRGSLRFGYHPKRLQDIAVQAMRGEKDA